MSARRALVRVDASVRMGAGHVMRCLTLARALRARGWRVNFVCRPMPGDLVSFIERQGFSVLLLAASAAATDELDHEHTLDGDAQTMEADETLALAGGKVELVVVDRYALGAAFEARLMRTDAKVLALDDLANRAHASHIVLDQNLIEGWERRYLGLVSPETRTLLGPSHALLRPEFAEVPLTRGQPPPRLLLSFGGTDPANVTALALGALDAMPLHAWRAEVVVGATNPHRAVLEARCERDRRCTLHVQTSRMAELMAAADLMLGAGGSTHWERCALGLPAIVLSLAENQRPATAAVAARGACVDLGIAANVTIAALAHTVAGLLADRPRLSAMGAAAAMLVPREGGARAVCDAVDALFVAGP